MFTVRFPRRLGVFGLALAALVMASGVSGIELGKPTYPAATAQRVPAATRGAGDLDKLAPDLQVLYRQFAGDSRSTGRTYSAEQLHYIFGIGKDNHQPTIQVAATLKPGSEVKAGPGLVLRHRKDDLAFFTVAVRALGQLVAQDAVLHVEAVPAAQVPQTPFRPQATTGDARRVRGEIEFDKQGLSGKGVLVGIIDTGIDWRHEDFRRPDGMTRILYLWDLMDESFSETEGKVGQEAPVGVELLGIPGMAVGTLYTDKEINQALQGEPTCNSTDLHGHGSACASIAAGNGRATSGDVPVGRWAGLAPDADLIICRAGDGSFDDNYIYAAQWMIETAKKLGRPIVINMSLGGHYSPHDGHAPTEDFLDDLVGDEPGAVICVSAGNEGRASFHASGRFGARTPGQMDVDSPSIEVFVDSDTELHAYFPAGDDWGLGITGRGGFLSTSAGEAGSAFVQKEGESINMLLSNNLDLSGYSDWFKSIATEASGNSQTRVVVPLPAGKYYVWAYGATAEVKDGTFHMYLPMTFQASFGSGTVKANMVGSPGNATNVITVGAYDFRDTWLSKNGSFTLYNLDLGSISDFSSPGYRRDGVIKPDITAPGRFAISAIADGSEMAKEYGDTHVTSDGYHVAWDGTSASSPYVTGVVALMLQKNPKLSANQVRSILDKSATSDRQTGATPNGTWGYGKVNPEAALRATPKP